jgi:hypothetical protein
MHRVKAQPFACGAMAASGGRRSSGLPALFGMLQHPAFACLQVHCSRPVGYDQVLGNVSMGVGGEIGGKELVEEVWEVVQDDVVEVVAPPPQVSRYLGLGAPPVDGVENEDSDDVECGQSVVSVVINVLPHMLASDAGNRDECGPQQLQQQQQQQHASYWNNTEKISKPADGDCLFWNDTEKNSEATEYEDLVECLKSRFPNSDVLGDASGSGAIDSSELASEVFHELPILCSDRSVYLYESSSSSESLGLEEELEEEEEEKVKENAMMLRTLYDAVHAYSVKSDGRSDRLVQLYEQMQEHIVVLQQQLEQQKVQLEQQQQQYSQLVARVEVTEFNVFDGGILPQESVCQSVSQAGTKSRKTRRLERKDAKLAEQAAFDSPVSMSHARAAEVQVLGAPLDSSFNSCKSMK